MKLMYFAWLRQELGVSEETVTPPDTVTTVENLLEWLAVRNPDFEALVKKRPIIRVAVNQEYADLDHAVTAADEVALFPPVTGG